MDAMWRLIEPLLRRWPAYPPDWQRRRMAVFERAYGRCESCGLPCGSVGLRNGFWRVLGAHVHHVRPRAAGGGHELSNLKLLCVECHRHEHPGNEQLGR